MSRKTRTSRARKAQAHKPRRTKRLLNLALPVLLVIALAVAAYLVLLPGSDPRTPAMPPRSFGKAARLPRKAQSLEALLKMSPHDLAGVDIAEMNLLCATGLPGAEGLDIDRCLARLEEWAARIKSETGRHLYKFRQDPGNYENSEGYYRMLMLITVLQQDFGVRYNMERVRNIDFTRSKDLFVHGMIDDDNGGTCVSMPVLYAAVARRLGNPVKLVFAKGHIFCRWDAPGQKFNIEATNQGMNSFDDDYYKTWPEKVSDGEVKRNRYLLSLSAPEELASFLASRGHCLLDNGRTREARDAYAAAHRLARTSPAYLAWARQAERRLRPAAFATLGSGGIPEPPRVYRRDPLAELRRVEAINAYNRRRIERRIRPPVPPRPPSPYPVRPSIPQPNRPAVRGESRK